MRDNNDIDPVMLAAELTVAWLSNNNTRAAGDDVPAVLRAMHDAVIGLSPPSVDGRGQAEPTYEAAVSVKKSLASPDYIISMIDGKAYKMLRRHLANNGLTPEQYRKRYNLKSDYPIVAPSYSEQRRETAKRTGLGSRDRQPKVAQDVAPAIAKPARKLRAVKSAIALAAVE